MQGFFAKFEPKDWVTLGIALWGAVLSTVLSIYQVRKDRRNITIALTLDPVHKLAYFRVTNISPRPFTLEKIGIKYCAVREDGKVWNTIEDAALTAMISDNLLPAVIEDGQPFTIEMGQEVYEQLWDHDVRKIKLLATDAEGKVYKGSVDRPPEKPMHRPQIY